MIRTPACWARWRRRRVAACRSIRVPRLLGRIGPLARSAAAQSMARPTAGGSGTQISGSGWGASRVTWGSFVGCVLHIC